MKKKTKRGFVRFSTSQCSMSRHKKSFSRRSTEENSAKPTVCDPCPNVGRHGVTHTTQKPTTYVYIYGGERVYVRGREQKSRVGNGGETTPPLVHPTALWTRPVDTPLEKSRLRGRAWPPEVNRSKTIENVYPWQPAFYLLTETFFFALFSLSLSLGPLNLNLHIGKKLRYRSLVNLRYSRLDCSLRR